MKNITIEIENFKGLFSQKEEWVMCKAKNVPLIKVQNIMKSNSFFESKCLDKITFPISWRLIVCSRYEGNSRVSFCITQIQNGKRIDLCTADNSWRKLSSEENFFTPFNSVIDSFIKKGFEKIII